MARQIQTRIEIDASAARVWAVLTDFSSFPEWNPFIRLASGPVEPGARIEIRVQPSGAGAMTFRPTLLRVEPQQELRWLGRLLVPGLFDGEHVFQVEPIGDDRVRFAHWEIFSGLLVPLFWRGLDTDTRRGFEEMNRALKARAEEAS